MKTRTYAGLLTPLLALAACAAPVSVKTSTKTEAKPGRTSASFSSEGVRQIELRAANAAEARIIPVAAPKQVVLTAKPMGGAPGYHPPPGSRWKETKAADWGLGFDAVRYGNRLVISSKNEVSLGNHHYALDKIEAVVPAGVTVKLVSRKLTGDGAPDLHR